MVARNCAREMIASGIIDNNSTQWYSRGWSRAVAISSAKGSIFQALEVFSSIWKFDVRLISIRFQITFPFVLFFNIVVRYTSTPTSRKSLISPIFLHRPEQSKDQLVTKLTLFPHPPGYPRVLFLSRSLSEWTRDLGRDFIRIGA